MKARKLVLGPDGLGKLKLGMSLAKALKTGELTGNGPTTPTVTGCHGGYTPTAAEGAHAPVFFGPDGLGAFTAFAGVTTPGGIELGSTYEDVRKAYPDWDSAGIGNRKFAYSWAKIPSRSDAVYNIRVENNAVNRLNLQLIEKSCYTL